MAAGAWTLFLKGAYRGNRPAVEILLGALALASVIFFVLIVVRSHDMAGGLWLAVAAFVLTFATLLGAYAGLDLQAAANDGSACLVEPNGVDLGAKGAEHIDKLDVLYFAVTTLSTIGFGDIVAHSDTCRRLVIGEVLLGFPALGIAVAGVAAASSQGLAIRLRTRRPR